MSEESEKKEKELADAARKLKDKYSRMYNAGKDPDHLQLESTLLERDGQITKLEKEMKDLKKQLMEMQRKLKIYEPEKYAAPNYMGYQTDWSSIRKVVFILKRNFRALTSLQVMQELLELEPFYKQIWQDPANNVSSLLSRACKNNLVERIGAPGMGAPIYKVMRKSN